MWVVGVKGWWVQWGGVMGGDGSQVGGVVA